MDLNLPACVKRVFLFCKSKSLLCLTRGQINYNFKLKTKLQNFLCFLAVDCMSPTISNSISIILVSGTVFGNKARVTCTPGYTGKGSTGVITCGSDATWGGFTCTGKILI